MQCIQDYSPLQEGEAFNCLHSIYWLEGMFVIWVSDGQVSICRFVYSKCEWGFDHSSVHRKSEEGKFAGTLIGDAVLAGCWTERVCVCVVQETRANRTITPPWGPSPATTFNPTGSTTPRRQPRRALRTHTHTPPTPRRRTRWALCLKTGRWRTQRTERSTS